MRTFRQYLELVQVSQDPTADINEAWKIIRQALTSKSKESIVRFALNCNKDIQHILKNPEADEYLAFAEKWLEDPESVDLGEIHGITQRMTLGVGLEGYRRAAAINVLLAITSSRPEQAAAQAAGTAIYAAQMDGNVEEMIKHYIREAQGLISEPKNSAPKAQFNLNDETDFKIAIDHLIDQHEDDEIIVNQGNRFFFKFYPSIVGRSRDELIQKVLTNRIAKGQVTRMLQSIM